jgi:hypothetical protein
MTKTRVFSIAVTLALMLMATARPAAAYVIQVLTSIPADLALDKATLERGMQAAVDDVAAHAVAFTPTIVSRREAMLIGDRIYLFVLITDSAGEEELAVLKADSESSGSR